MEWLLLIVLFLAIIVCVIVFGIIGWVIVERWFWQKQDPLVTKTPAKKPKPMIIDKKTGDLLEPIGCKELGLETIFASMSDGTRPINQKILKSQIICANPWQACFGRAQPIFHIIYDTAQIVEQKTQHELGKFHHNMAQYFKSFEEERVDKRVEDAVKLTKAKEQKQTQTGAG